MWNKFECINTVALGHLSSQVQVMCGSHSEMQHTRTTVVWPWRTLVKEMMPWIAELIKVLVAEVLILGIGLP